MDPRAAVLQLPPSHQDRLLALALFEEETVDLNVLEILAEIPEAPRRFAGVDRDAWEGMIESGVRAGLLARAMESVYRMLPGLPGVLAGLWRERAGAAFEEEREAARRACLSAYAAVGEWLSDQLGEEDDEIAMEVLEAEAPALAAAAGEALDRGLFPEAQSLLEPLNAFWSRTGRLDEADAWTVRGRRVLEAPEPDTPAGSLWFFLVAAQASRVHRAGDLDGAEDRYQELRAMLERSGSDWARSRLAATCHRLSAIAHERGDRDAAQAWHRKAHEALTPIPSPSRTPGPPGEGGV